MRILQLGPYPPPYGGIQVNLVAIRDFLLKHGHQCSVINITRHRNKDSEGGVYYPKSAFALLKLLYGLKYDVVHLHIGGYLHLRLLGLAFVCSLIPHRKSVLSFHSGGYPNSPAGRSARYTTLRGFVFRRFDCIIAVNPQIVEMFERFGVSRSRLRLIEPHAVGEQRCDLDFPAPLKAFIESHDPLLLTVGLLERHYDMTIQIDVLEEIRERWPAAGLVIIGSGSLEKYLAEHIASKSYAAHVLLCGDVEHPLTLRAIEECDLFLRTTFYDGDSIAVREALHFGVPVIATANGMRPPGVHLVPVSDASALTNAIFNQLTTGQGRSNSGAEGPQTGEPSDKNIAAVVDVYRELIEA